MTVTLNPEIQLFEYDIFDETFDVVKLEEQNILGGELGCKKSPVALVGYRVVPLGGSLHEIHLDASASHDPDGGPLKFRWDLDGDGLCDRATRGDPRTVFLTGPTCRLDPQHGKLCVHRLAMRIHVTDDEGESVENGFWIRLPQ